MKSCLLFAITALALGCGSVAEPSKRIEPPALASDGFVNATVDPCLAPTSTQVFYAKLWLGWWGSHDAHHVPPYYDDFIGPYLDGYPTADDFDPLKTGSTYWADTRFVGMVYGFQRWAVQVTEFDPGNKNWQCERGFMDSRTYKAIRYYATVYRPM